MVSHERIGLNRVVAEANTANIVSPRICCEVRSARLAKIWTALADEYSVDSGEQGPVALAAGRNLQVIGAGIGARTRCSGACEGRSVN